MDESYCSADEGTTSQTSHSNDDAVNDSAIEALPQGDLLCNEHGRDKVAVMRRNIAGRKKPTRQGLRDSLLKSMDESELQSILADVSIKEDDESTSVAAASVQSPTASEQSPSAAARTNSFKSPLMSSLNSDLTNVLKRRQSKKVCPKETDEESKPEGEATSDSDTAFTSTADTRKNKEKSLELPPIDGGKKPKVTQPIPDVIPQDRLPDLTIGSDVLSSEMDTSPEHRATPSQPFIKPPLRPISLSRRPSKENEQNPTPWVPKLNKVQRTPAKDSQASNNDEPSTAPWSPKLRKVEIPKKHVASLDENPPVLPPKPKLRPISVDQNMVLAQDDSMSGSLVLQQQTVPIASLPSKTVQSPTSTHPKFVKPQSSEKNESTRLPDEILNQRSLKPVADSPKMRKPQTATNSQPDWIKQAAEKRKRASVLIEQAEALANLSKGDGDASNSPITDQPVDSFVQLRHPNKTSRSSSIDSDSTISSQHSEASVPPWKRELNHQNSLRRIERRKKTQSAIEPSMSSFESGKENREDTSIPAWKKGLKAFSRGSVIEIKEDVAGGGAEPEFIKMFKKRQERLKKTGSQLIEME